MPKLKDSGISLEVSGDSCSSHYLAVIKFGPSLDPYTSQSTLIRLISGQYPPTPASEAKMVSLWDTFERSTYPRSHFFMGLLYAPSEIELRASIVELFPQPISNIKTTPIETLESVKIPPDN